MTLRQGSNARFNFIAGLQKFLLTFIFVCLSSPSLANIAINKSIIEFLPSKSNREDIEVRNTSDEQIYVQVEIFEIINPGLPNEEKIKHSDPKKSGLIVSPQKMAIPPKGVKLVRLVRYISAGDKDRIYRVKVAPVVGELFAEQTGVKVLVGYELLVMVRPKNPAPKLEVTRQGKKLLVRNEGNTNVLMYHGKQCRTEDDCEKLTSKRMYSGASWTLDLPIDGPVDFYIQGMELSATPAHYD